MLRHPLSSLSLGLSMAVPSRPTLPFPITRDLQPPLLQFEPAIVHIQLWASRPLRPSTPASVNIQTLVPLTTSKIHQVRAMMLTKMRAMGPCLVNPYHPMTSLVRNVSGLPEQLGHPPVFLLVTPGFRMLWVRPLQPLLRFSLPQPFLEPLPMCPWSVQAPCRSVPLPSPRLSCQQTPVLPAILQKPRG